MPWTTPTLDQVRTLARNNLTAQLRSGPLIPNSIARILSDSNAGLAYLVLLYLNWLAKQLLPDTAESEWLDRFAAIWLTSQYGGGRKQATFAAGTATVSGLINITLPSGSELSAPASNGPLLFQTTQDVAIGPSLSANVPIIALAAGSAGNLQAGTQLGLSVAISGLNSTVTVVALAGGTDQETDDELRTRIIQRIQMPPMGGDADDYVAWALQVPGVTRAWCSPLEMGVGTVTIRFMMDDLRATSDPMTNGFPLAGDVATVQAYIDSVRPVAMLDCFVAAPIPEPIDCTIASLDNNTSTTRAAIAAGVSAMLAAKAAPARAVNGVSQPAQEIFAAWVSDAVLNAPGVGSFDLVMDDHPMPSNGAMAVLGSITYA